jgi:hypothetical protein
MAPSPIATLTDPEQQRLREMLRSMGVVPPSRLSLVENSYISALTNRTTPRARLDRAKRDYEAVLAEYDVRLAEGVARLTNKPIPADEVQVTGAQARWLGKFFSKQNIDREAEDYAYVATMMCPKSDRLGRHAMVNIHAQLTRNIEWRTYLYFAGAMNKVTSPGFDYPETGISLGRGFTHGNEAGSARVGGPVWHRGHSPGEVSYPASVLDSGPGLGFILYCGGALVARMFYGAEGAYSFGDLNVCGNYRSPSASAFWRKQVERKFAKKLTNFMRNDCSTPLTVETINADDVMRTGLVVYLTQPAGSVAALKGVPIGPKQTPGFTRTAAESFDQYPGTPGEAAAELLKSRVEGPGGSLVRLSDQLVDMGQKYGIYFKDGSATYPLPQRGIKKKAALRLELLMRAYHGESPMLTFLNMETLALADSTAAVDYATRPDIARIIAASPQAKRLLQRLQQRRVTSMDGLAGLSDYELGEIGQAVTYAAAGRMPIDYTADNPLHLPKMPSDIKRELEQYGD